MSQAELPHSDEAERAVLGAVLLAPDLAKPVLELTAEDFYHERHRLIFAAFRRVAAAGLVIDLRTVQADLELRNQWAGVGGIGYIGGLDLDLPNINRLTDYVAIIRDRTARRRLIDTGIRLQRSAAGDDEVTRILSSARAALDGVETSAVGGSYLPLGPSLRASIDELKDRPRGEMKGQPTGLPRLDSWLNGLQRKKLYIIAGRPGSGKTAVAMQIAHHIGFTRRVGVAVSSIEMGAEELGIRQLAHHTGIDHGRIQRGQVGKHDLAEIDQAHRELADVPIFIDDAADMTLQDISGRARRLRSTRPDLALVVVDYLQIVTPSPRRETRAIEIGDIAKGLKGLAKEQDVAVLALAQLKRGDGRPTLADLREGAIENDADVVIFCHGEGDGAATELIIGKHRGGRLGTIKVTYNGPTLTFRERDARHQGEDGDGH